MRIVHVIVAPSTGAPLFKQAEETQITVKTYRRFLKWNLIEYFIHR